MKNKKFIKSDSKELLSIPLKESGMEYTGLKVVKLEVGEELTEVVSADVEACVVIVSGYVDAMLNDVKYENMGNRMSPFEDVSPYALYVTSDDSYSVKANTVAEIAICYAPGLKTYKSRVIEPSSMLVEKRGEGQLQRIAKNILPEQEDADSLLVVEVITEGGNWSSFAHRHDEDDLPNQSYLEEIYYHKLNPTEGGFAIQRIYNDDNSLDDLYSVQDGTAIAIKEGYHPVTVPPGVDSYYLNVMAGPTRTWKFYNEPFFEHLTVKKSK